MWEGIVLRVCEGCGYEVVLECWLSGIMGVKVCVGVRVCSVRV